MPNKVHHYAFDAAALLEECIDQLQRTIDVSKSQCYDFLFDLKESLITTECLLHAYFLQLLELETHATDANLPARLSSAVTALRFALEEKNRKQNSANASTAATNCKQRRHLKTKPSLKHRRQQTPFPEDLSESSRQEQALFPGDLKQDSNDVPCGLDTSWVHAEESVSESNNNFCKDLPCYYPSRNATNTLLFRLIVALQLCLLRIDDAHLVITGRCLNKIPSTNTNTCPVEAPSTKDKCLVVAPSTNNTFFIMAAAGVLGAGVVTVLVRCKKHCSSSPNSGLLLRTMAKLSIKVGIVALGAAWGRSTWNRLWVAKKITDSATAMEEWQQQWLVVQSTADRSSSSDDLNNCKETSSLDAKSRRLIEYALKESPHTSFWHSQGELRFLMLKRAMDIFYASVGTAVEAFHTPDEAQTSSWQIPLASAAISSFYALTGGSERASQAIKSSAKDLIQNAWGMVSLPAIKRLSLEASRLLKGAAVADRIDIAGVSCFVLSRDPSPDLSAALKRFHRKERRRSLSRLYTIDEASESTAASEKCACSSRQLAGMTGRYSQRDVIFHLTGGGFFAHIIASDLPYLLDWSASTGAVIICPEYALLPEHAFPVALNQVTAVYTSLISGDEVSKLGFRVNRIVVTGESTGGNLAAALCVKLGMQRQDELVISRDSSSDSDGFQLADMVLLEDIQSDVTVEGDGMTRESDNSVTAPRLPDALMLSCAVLNLTLELTHSRVLGTQDPVLPSGLISAISDAYLPEGGPSSKKDPLASPFFAPDEALQWFPPTLMFASSNDPLLDDSVYFNQRLHQLGLESDLRAAVNLPHAYWGLGTAGFPEAQQVQKECQDWLVHQLTRDQCTNRKR